MVNSRVFFSVSVRTTISSMAVRKIIFRSVGGQRSPCQISAKFSPITRILASSADDNAYRFPSKLASRSLTVPISSSFSFHRRSNSGCRKAISGIHRVVLFKRLLGLILQLLELVGQGGALCDVPGAQFLDGAQTGFHSQMRDRLQ